MKDEEIYTWADNGETALSLTPPSQKTILNQMRAVIECMWEEEVPVKFSILQTLIKYNIETKSFISSALKSIKNPEIHKKLLNYESINYIFTNKSICYLDGSADTIDIYHSYFDNSSLRLPNYDAWLSDSQYLRIKWYCKIWYKIKRFLRRKILE